MDLCRYVVDMSPETALSCGVVRAAQLCRGTLRRFRMWCPSTPCISGCRNPAPCSRLYPHLTLPDLINDRYTCSSSSAKLCMMSGQSSSPVMHDACEDLGHNYLKADIIQSLVLMSPSQAYVQPYTCVRTMPCKQVMRSAI